MKRKTKLYKDVTFSEINELTDLSVNLGKEAYSKIDPILRNIGAKVLKNNSAEVAVNYLSDIASDIYEFWFSYGPTLDSDQPAEQLIADYSKQSADCLRVIFKNTKDFADIFSLNTILNAAVGQFFKKLWVTDNADIFVEDFLANGTYDYSPEGIQDNFIKYWNSENIPDALIKYLNQILKTIKRY